MPFSVYVSISLFIGGLFTFMTGLFPLHYPVTEGALMMGAGFTIQLFNR